ncbi:DUF6884 domain-containing protein [Ammoniphilus sp. 3BR4]|uniref:DUF6884 domain-containing protein n=1 Tax=Ammoniphilus sp. 3BR4 TaxID=3158265 RepID=UPI0034669738
MVDVMKYYVDSYWMAAYWNTRFTRILLDAMFCPSQPKKRRIALIACVKQKKEGRHMASELYTSAWFVKVREYIEQSNFDQWYILSAKHHLISPTDVIESYPEHLNQYKKQQIDEWAQITAQQIKDQHLEGEQLVIFGSEKYRSLLLYLPDSQVEEPFKGMGISQQMAWMHQQTAGKPDEGDKNHV